jgi:hypothetical protein
VRVELYAEAAGFNVYGFLGSTSCSSSTHSASSRGYGGIALREGTSVIAGISITAQLLARRLGRQGQAT